MDAAYREALEIIAKAKEEQTESLNLSFLEIKEIPIEIEQLTQLTELRLHNTQISEIKGLEQLTQFTMLDLSNTQISEIKGLEQLTQLTTLDLSYTQISEIKGLEKLTQLTTLDLSYTQISEIKGLEQLTQLTTLDLSYTQISEIKGLEQLTQLTELHLYNTQISEIKGLEQLTQLTELRLHNTQISEIKGLEQLTQLTELHLYNTQISEIKGLEQLTQLTRLYLYNNQISEIKGLEQLTQLTELHLYENQISEIKGLEQLTQLTTLDLSYTQISEIKGLEKLTQLTRLYLYENQISEIKGLEKLTQLTTLYLYNTQISEIKGLEKLTQLTTLYLYNTQISEIKGLEKLTQLTMLYLHNTQISEIKGLEKLTQLTRLYLYNTQISEIKGLEKLTQLTRLYLYNTQISEIKGLEKLTQLTRLYLYNTQITTLPIYLLDLSVDIFWMLPQENSHKKGVYVKNTPLVSPPPELVQQGKEAIRRYLEEVEEEETIPLREAKLLILGAGGVGKTSLSHKLQNPSKPLPEEKDTTVGISVVQQPKIFPIEGEDYTLHIWDFGGQDIYHPTHQFFLTKNSIYVLMEDGRERVTDFNYWLQIQEVLAERSPLYILQNVKNESRCIIPIQQYRGTFDNIKEYFEIDLSKVQEDNPDFYKLVVNLKKSLQTLPHIGELWPKTRFEIRDALLKLRDRNYIYLDEYIDICKQHGYEDSIAQRELLTQLHYLGTILHFENPLSLDDLVITNPQWATDAVYAILDHTKRHHDKKGHFDWSDLKVVWKDQKYKGLYKEILTLMEKFELSFELLEQKESYIAPLLLPEDQPSYEWEDENVLKMRYEYGFMPKGILARLIVRLHREVKDELFWKKGVVLEKGNSSAEIIEDVIDENIMIKVQGQDAKSLMFLISDEIDQINSQYHFEDRLKVKKLVPCICRECQQSAKKTPNTVHFYNYHYDLLKRLERGKTTIECSESYIDVNVLELLDNVTPEGKRNYKKKKGEQSIFISYSHEDIDYRDKLKNQLKPLLRSHSHELWYDHEILPGQDWNQEIQNNLERADMIILLISIDFLSSDYIYDIERPLILDKYRKGTCTVIPILVRDTAWEDSDWAGIQAIPTYQDTGKLKSIDLWKNKDSAWKEVVFQIEKVLNREKNRH